MEVVFLIITMTLVTVVSGTNFHETRREQEFKFYSKCLDNAKTTEDRKICKDLFTNK